MTIAKGVNTVLRNKKAGLLLIPLLFLCVSLSAQNTLTVKGRVLDEKNTPVAGASVTVKDAKNGVTTDADGNFSITVPARATLEISHIGFVTREIKARAGSIDIMLQAG